LILCPYHLNVHDIFFVIATKPRTSTHSAIGRGSKIWFSLIPLQSYELEICFARIHVLGHCGFLDGKLALGWVAIGSCTATFIMEYSQLFLPETWLFFLFPGILLKIPLLNVCGGFYYF